MERSEFNRGAGNEKLKSIETQQINPDPLF